MESTKRTKQLKEYLSSRFVDFDSQSTTDRLHSLYSDFSNLNILNPYAYESNIKYWRDVILDCNMHGHLNTGEEYCMINVEELPDLFYRVQKGKPLSLNSVTVNKANERLYGVLI
jgi:hypothetical protein